MHSINMYVDNGPPCLIPLEGVKKGVLVPLINMATLMVVIKEIISWIVLEGNPK